MVLLSAVLSITGGGPIALAIPIFPIFSDGFETGDASMWSSWIGAQCSACHGFAGNPAPPKDLSGDIDTSFIGVGAHRRHLAGSSWHKVVLCTECHIVPSTPADPGHYDSAHPAELTWGPLATARGATPLWDGTSCSNAYCHSNGWTASGNMVWTENPVLSCSSCHADQSTVTETNMSGKHQKHVDDRGFDCAECHGATVDSASQIIAPSLHIDGVPQIAISVGAGWNPGLRTCTLTCHEKQHESEPWG